MFHIHEKDLGLILWQHPNPFERTVNTSAIRNCVSKFEETWMYQMLCKNIFCYIPRLLIGKR